ncbi:MAG: gas vesicle protein GvpN [Bryobacteraceae bacterium]
MTQKQTVLRMEPREDFVMTPSIEAICRRAEAYLEAGYACHFSGPSGTGKTTLALHVAGKRHRPVMLIFGNEEFGTSDLVGAEKGLLSTKVVDNFIHSVLKTEESHSSQWVDNRLTTACKHGYTLVYDEFSRSRPEANNALLTILEEGILALPEASCGDSYMRVHPDFRAIFTSNPEEYAGVHKTQNALLDRMITIELGHYDRDTEIAISRARAGLDARSAQIIVDLVREFRKMGISNFRPTIRACIMVGRVVQLRGGRISADDPVFVDTCLDVLGSDVLKIRKEGASAALEEVTELIRRIA